MARHSMLDLRRCQCLTGSSASGNMIKRQARDQVGPGGPINKGERPARRGLHTRTNIYAHHLERSEATVPTTTGGGTELARYGEPRQRIY